VSQVSCPRCGAALFIERTLRRQAHHVCVACDWRLPRATPANALRLLDRVRRQWQRATTPAQRAELAVAQYLLVRDAREFTSSALAAVNATRSGIPPAQNRAYG
jgi:predicted RNA-binding Zn-ribbon protein involved in translation (DUF1610 family)